MVLGQNLVEEIRATLLFLVPLPPKSSSLCHCQVLISKAVFEQVGGIFLTLSLGEHIPLQLWRLRHTQASFYVSLETNNMLARTLPPHRSEPSKNWQHAAIKATQQLRPALMAGKVMTSLVNIPTRIKGTSSQREDIKAHH